MTTDEQNEIDITRVTCLRNSALHALNEFTEWYMPGEGKYRAENIMLLRATLAMDIRRGTEDEVNRILDSLQERNQMAFLRKLDI